MAAVLTSIAVGVSSPSKSRLTSGKVDSPLAHSKDPPVLLRNGSTIAVDSLGSSFSSAAGVGSPAVQASKSLKGSKLGNVPPVATATRPVSFTNSILTKTVEKVFADSEHTSTIDLSARKLKEYPDDVAAEFDLLDALRADLSRNRLTDISPKLCELYSLESLDCYHNVIRSLPTALTQLQNLVQLNLNRNLISVLPEFISRLRCLEVLLLNNNKLISLPNEIGQLNRLMQLDVGCNELTQIPDQLSNLQSLCYLNLRRNHLTRLTPGLGRLCRLRRLDISCNDITQIPLTYKDLTQLEEFLVDNNPLTSPPAHMCRKGSLHVLTYLSRAAQREERKRAAFTEASATLCSVQKKSPLLNDVEDEGRGNDEKKVSLVSRDNVKKEVVGGDRAPPLPPPLPLRSMNISSGAVIDRDFTERVPTYFLQTQEIKSDSPTSRRFNKNMSNSLIDEAQTSDTLLLVGQQMLATDVMHQCDNHSTTKTTVVKLASNRQSTATRGMSSEEDQQQQSPRHSRLNQNKPPPSNQNRLRQLKSNSIRTTPSQTDNSSTHVKIETRKIRKEKSSIIEYEQKLIDDDDNGNDVNNRTSSCGSSYTNSNPIELNVDDHDQMLEEEEDNEHLEEENDENEQNDKDIDDFENENADDEYVGEELDDEAENVVDENKEEEVVVNGGGVEDENSSDDDDNDMNVSFKIELRDRALSKVKRSNAASLQLILEKDGEHRNSWFEPSSSNESATEDEPLPITGEEGTAEAETDTSRARIGREDSGYQTLSRSQDVLDKSHGHTATSTSAPSSYRRSVSDDRTLDNKDKQLPPSGALRTDNRKNKFVEDGRTTKKKVVEHSSEEAEEYPIKANGSGSCIKAKKAKQNARDNDGGYIYSVKLKNKSRSANGNEHSMNARSTGRGMRRDEQEYEIGERDELETRRCQIVARQRHEALEARRRLEEERGVSSLGEVEGEREDVGRKRRGGLQRSVSKEEKTRWRWEEECEGEEGEKAMVYLNYAHESVCDTTVTQGRSRLFSDEVSSSSRRRNGVRCNSADLNMNPLFTIRRHQKHVDIENEEMRQLRQMIESLLHISLPGDLSAALSDGVVLCHLANHIRPRSVPTIHVPSATMVYRHPSTSKLSTAKCHRNVENFLLACRRIGVEEGSLCDLSAIVDSFQPALLCRTIQSLLTLDLNTNNATDSTATTIIVAMPTASEPPVGVAATSLSTAPSPQTKAPPNSDERLLALILLLFFLLSCLLLHLYPLPA